MTLPMYFVLVCPVKVVKGFALLLVSSDLCLLFLPPFPCYKCGRCGVILYPVYFPQLLGCVPSVQ